MYGFVIGLPCGLAMGIGAGIANGRAAAHKKLKSLVADGKIRVTDSDGNSITSDEVIALLAAKSRKTD